MYKKEVRIKEWAVITDNDSIYQAPEQITRRLKGKVIDHPSFPEGHNIVSSRIHEIDLSLRRVETNNTIYLLEGEPEVEYAKYLEETEYNLKAKMN